jgi:hypothetical protein
MSSTRSQRPSISMRTEMRTRSAVLVRVMLRRVVVVMDLSLEAVLTSHTRR